MFHMRLAAISFFLAAGVCGAESPCPPSFIGTAGLGHITPAAASPFGMVQAGPDTSAKPDRFIPNWPHTGGYQHGDGWLWRFSQTHISGTGVPALGDFGILPFVDGFDGAARPARMLKDTERAEPGFYAVSVDEDGARIDCSVAALAHSAVYRFVFPKGRKARLVLDLDWGMGNPGKGDCWGKYVMSSQCEFPVPNTVRGGRRVWIWNGYQLHFAAEFSAPIAGKKLLRDDDGVRGKIYELDFGEVPDGVLEVRMALSPTSPAAAQANLAAELKGLSQKDAAAKASAAWNAFLGRIELDARTPADTAASFRAAFMRTMYQPNDWSDVGDEPFFSTLSLWDTFRAAHPLYTIFAPEKVDAFVSSMLRQCDEQGYLPIWAVGRSDNHCMIGHHAVPVIADAWLKGFRGFDGERAWRAVRQSLTVDHHPVGDGTWGLLKEDWDLLDKYGYYPFDKMRGEYRGRGLVRGESAARTLECAYDDACAARFAAALGKKEDAAFFARRSENWRNVFDPSVGFMRGKDSKGNWRTPFDPYALGGGPWTDNDFCEGNSWQYTWHVMHAPDGLIAAFGGSTPFTKKLLGLFEQPPRDYKERPTADVTGLIGQYAHGNEPSHHTIYFFTLAGRPDLAAKYVRKVFDTQYFARPDGLCGNDDCGQMAAWYVFSALGFYPFDPCGGEYVLGAPQVPSATLRLPNGKTFRIVAENFSPENIYPVSVSLNGRPVADWKLRHSEILAGGELVFRMAPLPPAPPATPAAGKIRLMSFNIRIGCGHDDPFKLPKGSLGHLPQCAAVIRALQPDVVGLQEVDNGNSRTWKSDQTAELAKLCGMEGAWVEKVPGYGISVLFRKKPLKVSKTLMPGKVHTRVLLVAEFEDYIVANTHFPLSAETCANAARIVRETLKGAEKPVFLMGDFNSRPESEAITLLKEDFAVISGETAPTWPAKKPDRVIDFIMLDKAHADSFTVLSRGVEAFPDATDHCALWTDVAPVPAPDTLVLPGGRRISKTVLTGHRGDSRSLPENTILAIRHALDNGFSFECDFYMSNDGEVFCSHDMWLKRCFGLSKFATNVCWKGELENVDVGALKDVKFAGRPDCRVPRIDDVLALIPEGRVVTLEVKDPRPEIVRLIRAAWNRHPNMKEENVIFLAHKATRAALVKEFPRATYQHCVNCYSDGWKKGCTPIPVQKQLEGIDARPECLNYSTMHDMDLLTREYVDAVHKRGRVFFTWCVDDPAEAVEVFRRGVDGICTNCPKELWDGMARLLMKR